MHAVASLGLTFAFALTLSGIALAQTWPERPIRLVVGFPPGGSGDFIARNMSDELQRLLGQQIIVDNRPGAGSNIAADIVARANPDGYTVLLGGSFTHAVNPVLYKKIPFHPEKDFSPVTKVANFTTIIAVNPKLPVNTLRELIEKRKRSRGNSATARPAPALRLISRASCSTSLQEHRSCTCHSKAAPLRWLQRCRAKCRSSSERRRSHCRRFAPGDCAPCR